LGALGNDFGVTHSDRFLRLRRSSTREKQ
jgi:hypothetical protein